MGDSLDSYRSRIGGFAARLCCKMSSSSNKSRKRQKKKEKWMALVGIRNDSWDFWSNFLTLVMILVSVLSLVDLSVSTVSLATMDGALLGQHNGAAVTRPISVSVIKIKNLIRDQIVILLSIVKLRRVLMMVLGKRVNKENSSSILAKSSIKGLCLNPKRKFGKT